MEGDEKKCKPFEIDSFPSLEVLHGDIRYVNKKRKFLDGQVGPPGQKPKFGELSCGSEEYAESSIEVIGGTADPASSYTESSQDGNSFVGEYHAAIFVDVDSQDRANHDQHSTSSSEHSDAFISNLFSLQSRTPKRNLEEQLKELHCTDVDDAATFGTGTGSSKEQLNDYGMNYADFMCSEFGIGDKEQSSELTAEEMMLYSNDISPHLYVLSSGALGTHPEARSVSRKPTIDQEFEQYFDTLML